MPILPKGYIWNRLIVNNLAELMIWLNVEQIDNEHVSQRSGCFAQKTGTLGLINKMNN